MGSIRSRALTPDEVDFHPAITDELRRVAEDRRLAYEPYYHDELLWILSDQLVGKGHIARLQLSLMAMDGRRYLSVVQSISFVDLARRISRLPRHGRASQADITRFLENGAFRKRKFRNHVEKLWAEAEAWRDQGLAEPGEDDADAVTVRLSENVAAIDLAVAE
jgi:hypothetical protein